MPMTRATIEALQAVSVYSLFSDAKAIGLKALRSGIGGSPKIYASGLNRYLRSIGLGVLKIGDSASPAMAVIGTFSISYDATVMIQCELGLLQ